MLPPLPIDSILPDVRRALGERTRLIVEAAPGAGKTSRVPLALYQEPWMKGRRLVMLEPRRLAARAAATYMARLLGESVGRSVGYRTALESRDSPATRILVVTEGILTRLIQHDPGLEGIGCLIFDEFHERSLHADLGLALSLDCQDALRPDLRLVVMSATLDGEALSALLDCPCVTAPGRSFPVAVRHLPPVRPDAPCEEQAAAAVRLILREEQGSLLVFLPGAGEIRRTAARLASLPENVRIRPLYGDLPSEEQDAAVASSQPGERKIVLATNIAETSLTIEGIRIVIDSGLSRRQRLEPAWGMSRLVTERVSRASADQRCGRAGRLEPGVCLRLWPEHEHAALQAHSRPEILDSDLASFRLELAVWGVSDPARLRWLDMPPQAAWEQAGELLRNLDALDAAGQATARGRAMAELPLHPRLAHMVLEAKTMGYGAEACALAALFGERDPLRSGANAWGADINHRLTLLLDSRAGDAASGQVRRLREQMRRIAARAGVGSEPAVRRGATCTTGAIGGTYEIGAMSVIGETCAGVLTALAWPERVAVRRAPCSYLMTNGRGAVLAPGDPLTAHDCLAIAELDAAGADARIHLAAPLAREALESLFGAHILHEDVVVWDPEREAVSARRLRRLGALTLAEAPLAEPSADRVRAVLLDALDAMGVDRLPWSQELSNLRQRVRFVRALRRRGVLAREDSPEWPDLSDAALAATLPDWLGPYLTGPIDRLSRITPAVVTEAVQGLLPWPLPRKLDTLAPERMTVPSGSSYALDYAEAADALERLPESGGAAENAVLLPGPVLAVKLQEMFGLDVTPTVVNGRVPVIVHLLSPAGRPVQITRDLAGFWRQGYAAVRAELRGRYPRHPWPDDPLVAMPTRHTKKKALNGKA